MTAERRPDAPLRSPDPLALALAAAIREIQAKRVAERAKHRATMAVLLGGRDQGEAA